ncbi:MAG: 2'-5' RNA ligase family protein [Microcystaceae cyanobacterium]
MDTGKRRFFIALLPPPSVQQVANQIKDEFEQNYCSKAAKKSPPHITLQPPFEWEWQYLEQLTQTLEKFCQTQSTIPITLEGFGAFKPRVIYINVLSSPILLTVQKALSDHVETELNIVDPMSKKRPFCPHLTVAFRDLKKSDFKEAWPIYQEKSLHFEFTVSQLTLLLHNGRQWKIYQSFDLISN